MTKYFETPVQVIFRMDEETMIENGVHWFTGIAYRDEIICGCCGGIFNTDEPEHIQPLPWVDISEAIAGDLLNE